MWDFYSTTAAFPAVRVSPAAETALDHERMFAMKKTVRAAVLPPAVIGKPDAGVDGVTGASVRSGLAEKTVIVG